MTPLTETQLRAALVNATRSERQRLLPPDLDSQRWDRLEYLGWRDRKQPLAAYVVAEIDGAPTGIILRAPETGARRSAMCAWCEHAGDPGDVAMFVARRGGASGRKGNTIGTLICTDFRCSRNVRRRPTLAEAGADDDGARAAVVERRIAGLTSRVTAFVEQVRSTV
ncbi:FBP domain-containing protein [Isoptericola haloaureus]|uniref:FBP domain-containing protein n=1 Tax=Isoptericola haloaureus TaxID=1542902 RepID=A0ABU7Z3J7_9MICO